MEDYHKATFEKNKSYQALDNHKIDLFKKLGKGFQRRKKENTPVKVFKGLTNFDKQYDLETMQNRYMIDKMDDTLLRIRQANEENVNNLSIVIHNQTKKDLKKTMMNIHQTFQKEVFTIKKEKELMLEEFSVKTRTFTTLADHFINQRFIGNEYEMIEPEFIEKNNYEDENERIKEMRNQIPKDLLYYETLKIINISYKDEAAEALRKVQNINEEIKKIGIIHVKAVKNLEKIIGNREKAVLNEAEAIRSEYEDFKNRIMQEMHLRILLEERQKSFIKTLYEELKNAKTILNNPTLRRKTYEKLRETLSPTINDRNFPNIIQTEISTKEGDYYRQVYSPVEPMSSRSNISTRRARSSFKS